ncbi:fructose-1,6-bisphosphatase-3 [Pilibacter termitis]|uniref:Fructose-1,6-bisphosphatase class 3 n=1 Tax=Pilibacter termitis TaxID=263852 RepID=A0A1T4QMK8_9ENTE|nr:fructose-1,6-bisphosphatase [Pilibacter termitis]SKA04857.1 fructose-1,6-bisphosphatase-3 [Pilibacter termitis]
MKRENYYKLLFEKYGSKEEVYAELINLEAILNLPKATELFLSDIHGADGAFDYILRTGAGNLKEKIVATFASVWDFEKVNEFTLLVAYPELFLQEMTEKKTNTWQKETILDLICLLKFCASKYTRSKVRKSLPKEFAYIIEELLYMEGAAEEKENYYEQILERVITLQQGEIFIVALSLSIQRLVIDHLHIVGDVYDRGSGAHKIMNRLEKFHSVDFQWGNHDILWLGARVGSSCSMITLLRIAARYKYLLDLEEAYGINLRPLYLFAEKNYKTNPRFTPKATEKNAQEIENDELLEKVHQALAIIQFKLEGQIIQRRKEFQMDDRLLLEKIDFDRQTITLEDESYSIESFPRATIDPQDIYALSAEEKYVLDSLTTSFQNSEPLKRHVHFLLEKGAMYQVYNGQLLFHGCIPLLENGDFASFTLEGHSYEGKALLDAFEHYIRQSARNIDIHDDFATDLIWYCWCGEKSPLFGRKKMTTFERYFIPDKLTHKEMENPYFSLRDEEETCKKILEEFGLFDQNARIINGHTPVKVRKGETPTRANGKLFIIDGGMSRAYQKTTGIAGYSLLNNSYGFQIVTHQPFKSIEEIFEQRKDPTTVKNMIDGKFKRRLIKDTTIGKEIQEQIDDLLELLGYLEIAEE